MSDGEAGSAAMHDEADYEAQELRELARGGDARRAVWALRFVDGGASLVSASDDGAVRRWRCDDGAVVRAFEGCAAPVALDVTPDAGTLVCAGAGGDVVLWDLASGLTLHRWALDLTDALGAASLHSRRQHVPNTYGAAVVLCAPDGASAWVHGGGRAYVLQLTAPFSVVRRMRDVIAVGHGDRGGEPERLWLDKRGVHRTAREAATRTLTGVTAYALRSEPSDGTPILFSPCGERLVLSKRRRVRIDEESMAMLSVGATEACRADECTALALTDDLELWATGYRNELSKELGALSLRVGDGRRARVGAGIDLTEPDFVTALALTDDGRVAVGTSAGAIRVFDVDLTTSRRGTG